MIYQNDDYGKDYLYGLRVGLGKSYADQNIVATEAVEVTSTSSASQMVKIRSSGAAVLVIFQTPTPTVRSIATGKALGFNPDQIYMNSVSAFRTPMDGAVASAGAAYVNGILSVAYLKDSDSPRWENDAAMKQYRTIVEKYLPGRNPKDGQIYYGVAKAETFVQALYKAGKNPTRAGLMNAILSLNSPNKFTLPGVTQKTTKTDHWVISQMQLQRYNATAGTWVLNGKLIDGRPR